MSEDTLASQDGLCSVALGSVLYFRKSRRRGAGSISDGVIGNFHWHNPSGRIMALGL